MADVAPDDGCRHARRESEDRYRGIVSQSLAGIVETNPTGRFDIVNDWYCQMTGYSREELLHLWMQDITHAEDLPRNLQLIEKLPPKRHRSRSKIVTFAKIVGLCGFTTACSQFMMRTGICNR
jgi:PAS domain S-box-containing protein